MDRSSWRHILTAFSLLAIGPLAGAIAGDIRLPGGSPGATSLSSESPVHGGIMLVIALVLVGATGTLGARLFGSRHGTLCAGLVAAWIAWNQGTTEGVLINARSGAPLPALAVEGMVVGIFLLLTASAIFRAAPRFKRSASPGQFRNLPMTLGAVAVGAGAGLLGVHLFGVESLKGQSVFAVFVGAVLAGAAARLVISDADESAPRDAAFAGFGSIALLCAAGPIAALVVHGEGVAAAAFAGRLVRIANPSAADWLAGGLLGVPIGVWWASAMMPPSSPHPAPT